MFFVCVIGLLFLREGAERGGIFFLVFFLFYFIYMKRGGFISG